MSNAKKLTPEEIEKLVDAEIINMIEQEPAKMIMFMLSQMGRQVVDSNAATLDLATEATFNEVRYKIKARITAKKIKIKNNEQ